jgi:hypothetical protein
MDALLSGHFHVANVARNIQAKSMGLKNRQRFRAT